MRALLGFVQLRHIAVAVVAVLCAVGLYIGLQVHDGDQPKLSESHATASATVSSAHRSSTPSTAPIHRDPAKLVNDRTRINRRVKAFVPLYFSRAPKLTPEKIRNNVKQFVTHGFMKQANFGYGRSAGDMAMQREGASTKVSATRGLTNGEFVDTTHVSGSLTVLVTKYDQDGDKVLSFTRPQEISLVKQHGQWYIDYAPIT